MRKLKHISRQAMTLGLASWIALACWHSTSKAQEGATSAPKENSVKDKRPDGFGHNAAQNGRPSFEQKGKAGHAPGRGDLTETSPNSRSASDQTVPSKANKKPVSRDEAIAHYRAATESLEAIPEVSDPKSDAAAEARKVKREATRELRRARDEILRAHNDSRRAFQKRDPEDVEKLRKQVNERTANLRKDRKDRSEAQRNELIKELGDKPLHPAVRDELRNHAWKVARLNQVDYLAQLDNKPELAKKAETLLEQEATAHQRRLKAILAKPEVKKYKPPVAPKSPETVAGHPVGLPPGHPPLPAAAPEKTAQPAGVAK